MKKIILIGFLAVFGTSFSQNQNEIPIEQAPTQKPDPTLEELKQYVTSLTKPLAEQIDPQKVNGYGKKMTSVVKFSVDEKRNIEPGSLVVSGDNVNFNQEVERLIKPLLEQWKPILSTNSENLSKYWFQFPIGISFE